MTAGTILLVPATVLSLLFGLGMASLAHADQVPVPPPENVQIELPPHCVLGAGDEVECEVSRQYGVKRIRAYIDTGVGDVEVFDQTYENCPTTVEFELDPIVLDYETSFVVESCDPPLPRPGVGQPDRGSFKVKTEPVEPIRGIVSPK